MNQFCTNQYDNCEEDNCRCDKGYRNIKDVEGGFHWNGEFITNEEAKDIEKTYETR